MTMAAASTVWITTPWLEAKTVLPRYEATILSLPTGKEETVKLATPEASRATVPRKVLPHWNLTFPVAVPDAATTVAVSVTGSPDVDGFGDDVTVVVVDTRLTVCVTLPALVWNSALPL